MDKDYAILRHSEGVGRAAFQYRFICNGDFVSQCHEQRIDLKRYIESIKQHYDYILIDGMPSLGMLTINVWACADSVLIPVQAAYLPIKGLQQLMKTNRYR